MDKYFIKGDHLTGRYLLFGNVIESVYISQLMSPEEETKKLLNELNNYPSLLAENKAQKDRIAELEKALLACMGWFKTLDNHKLVSPDFYEIWILPMERLLKEDNNG